MKKNLNQTSTIVKVRKLISISACLCMITSNAVLAPAGNYDQPYHRTPCDDGACVPYRPTNGYHATKWRAWPGSENTTAPVNKSNIRTPHGVPPLENPIPKNELDHPAPPPSAFAKPQDSGSADSQPAPSGQPSQPGTGTPPGQRDNIPNFKAPPKDPTDLSNPLGTPLGNPTINMSYNKDVSDSSNIPTDQAPPLGQSSGLKILPQNRFSEPASTPKRLPSRSSQFQSDRSDVEKLLDNGPRFRNANDPQSSITPEDLEQNDRPETVQGEPVRISMNNARTVLNIQEPKIEPNRFTTRETTPAISTTIQRTSANSPAMTPRISVPSTSNQMNNQSIQRADFNSVGNASGVTPLNHYTPVTNEMKAETKGNDLMKEYQSATLKIVQSPASNPSSAVTQSNPANQMSSVQFAPAKTVSYQSNSASAPVKTFDAGPMISAPTMNTPIISAPPIDTTVRVAPPSNPLRGVATGNPLRRN